MGTAPTSVPPMETAEWVCDESFFVRVRAMPSVHWDFYLLEYNDPGVYHNLEIQAFQM